MLSSFCDLHFLLNTCQRFKLVFCRPWLHPKGLNGISLSQNVVQETEVVGLPAQYRLCRSASHSFVSYVLKICRQLRQLAAFLSTLSVLGNDAHWLALGTPLILGADWSPVNILRGRVRLARH